MMLFVVAVDNIVHTFVEQLLSHYYYWWWFVVDG